MARRLIGLSGAAAVAFLAVAPALAGEADVIAASITRLSSGAYHFDVTVRSKDTGWSRYADRIEVLAPDGTILATRVLYHPHDDEQPFTRDVPDVRVPRGINRVRVRAHFKPVGYDGAELTVPLDTARQDRR